MRNKNWFQLFLLFLLIISLCLVWISQLFGLIIFSIVLFLVIIDLLYKRQISIYLFGGINKTLRFILGFIIFFLFIVNTFNLFDYFNLEASFEYAILLILFSVYGFLRIFFSQILKKDYFYPNIKAYLIITSVSFVIMDTISNGKLGIIGAFFTGIIFLLEAPDLILKYIIDSSKIKNYVSED